MRVLLDANVLYPTVMREVLLGCASRGLFSPRWSARVLEEWARAAARIDPAQEVVARGEIALVEAAFPEASVRYPAEKERQFWLPDAADIHVLTAAVAGHCDAICTMNAKDFPKNLLAEEGLERLDPDGFLLSLHARAPDAVVEIGAGVLAQARALSGEDWTMRKLMKKARLPRLGKALEA